jgi:hypothetical protein
MIDMSREPKGCTPFKLRNGGEEVPFPDMASEGSKGSGRGNVLVINLLAL